MSERILTEADMEPLLEGLAFLGTGGGGSPAFGRAIIENDLRRGRIYHLIDPDDVPDNAQVVSGGIIGSVKAVDTAAIDEIIGRWEEQFELLLALRTMEGLLGKNVDYIVPFELGGLNTPVMLSLGARVGIPVIDGDGLGRAAPETQMTSFYGHGIAITPMPLVDTQNNVIIVKNTGDAFFPDKLGRWVVTNSEGMGANSHYPMDGRTLKSSVIPRTITKALELGRALLQARERGDPPLVVAKELVNGHLLLERGRIKEIKEDESGGFLRRLVLVEGAKGDKGKEVELTIKNEVMLCRAAGREVCIFPDLTIIADPDTGRGLMSSELKVGQEIGIILAPCHPRLREGLAHPQRRRAFSPARFGCADLEYTPLEELIAGRRL
jgi:DUF917 family protein